MKNHGMNAHRISERFQVYRHPDTGKTHKVSFTGQTFKGEKIIRIHEEIENGWKLLTEIPISGLLKFLEEEFKDEPNTIKKDS